MADPAIDSAARPATDVSLADVLSWDDVRFGPARDFASFRLAGPEPAWWVCTSMLGRAPVGTWYSTQRAGAAGTSIDRTEAQDRHAGELLERYSALNAPIEGEQALPDVDGFIGRFPRCRPDEPCPDSFRAIDPEIPLTHVAVERLANGLQMSIPAGFVHLGFWPQAPEPPVTLPISTGLAFHRSVERAIWGGLCEVAERDAMMLTWWLRRPASEIDCTGNDVPEVLVDRLERLASVHLRPRLFDITTDFGVPTVFCILAGDRYPFAVVGASCKADPGAACTKALDEAVSARVMLRGQQVFDLPSTERFEWVELLEHHLLLYADGRLSEVFDFLLGRDRPLVAFSEFAAQEWLPAPADLSELRELALALENRGLTVAWVDVTAPEALPYGHVVKVIVPEMVPLSQSHRARWLATPRLLREASFEAGSCASFNPFPHPFA